jgi:polyvinyl alcohol dehydrogenase (cytochrome)
VPVPSDRERRHRKGHPLPIRLSVALAAAALAGGVTISVGLAGPPLGPDWRMIGHDPDNSRSQPFEHAIGPGNVARLAPKWVLSTAGDVSATPAVVHGAVYVPDWGGKLWKINAETGEVLWSRSIAEYTGIAGAVSRTSPAVAHGLLYVGSLRGARVMAIDAATGDLRWITQIETHPAATVSNSPVVVGNRVYIGTSGLGGVLFRGSVVALDAHTGRIVWKTYTLPEEPAGFSGGVVLPPPAIDLTRGLLYTGVGDLHAQPDSVTSCLAAAPGGWSEACFPAGAYFASILALDLRTGEPRWSFRGAGADAWQLACGDLPPSVTWCPAPNDSLAWDFTGSGPNLFRVRLDGRWRDVVGVGEKSGVYWALDRETGELLWSTLVGPGSTRADGLQQGGMEWGTAIDGTRIYAAIGNVGLQSYVLQPSGSPATAGSWSALDPASGRILWQTADPQDASDTAPVTVANGVLYAGSMARTGDQMYALDAATGQILWRFASGGSVNSGPAVVDGTVYWGSGYGRLGLGSGNNKLYAFSLDGN